MNHVITFGDLVYVGIWIIGVSIVLGIIGYVLKALGEGMSR